MSGFTEVGKFENSLGDLGQLPLLLFIYLCSYYFSIQQGILHTTEEL